MPSVREAIEWGEDSFTLVFNVLFTEDSPEKINWTHLPLATSSLSDL